MPKTQKSHASRRAWGTGSKGRHNARPGATPPAPKRLVAVNEKGRRIGEDHPNAVLTNRDVELIFELHEQGWGSRRICKKLECGRSVVKRILRGERRAQTPARYKLV